MDIVTLALAKKYANKKVADLGKVFNVQGKKASVSQLPATGNKSGDVYLVGPNSTDQSYDEYFWNEDTNKWELMGKSAESSILYGTTAPSSTQAAAFLGQVYIDKVKGKIYQCTNITNGTATWTKIIAENDQVSLTKAQYDAVATKDPDTYYYIIEDEETVATLNLEEDSEETIEE